MKTYAIAIFVALFAVLFLVAEAQRCAAGEEFRSCGIPAGCARNCSTRDIKISCVSACGAPGCYCAEDYIRQYTGGPCILESECPECAYEDCAAGEEFRCCGTPAGCERNCSTRDTAIRCNHSCGAPGCYCAEDYVRQYTGGPCIPKSDCPERKCTTPAVI